MWDPPNVAEQNGIIIEYTINVTAVETREEFEINTDNSTFTTVSNLRPFTTYQFIIAASTSVGMGPFSTVFTHNTPQDGKIHYSIVNFSLSFI